MATEQQRPEVAAQRLEFDTSQALGIDPDRFVFLDETWVKTKWCLHWTARSGDPPPSSMRSMPYCWKVEHCHSSRGKRTQSNSKSFSLLVFRNA